jgi:DNA-binding LytR/AlgR family response regulator
MRIRIEADNTIEENEIVIRCSEVTGEVKTIKAALEDMFSNKNQIAFCRGGTEYYLPLEDILFFETEENGVCAHTADSIYSVGYKLYELEEFLPGYFTRVSKSAILNTNRIYSITRSISSSSRVEFQNTHKQVYVSRHYYKPLKNKLLEKR